MGYIIAFSQLLLFIVFIITLKCELSKNYTDSVLAVSARTLIMCLSSILFFILNEYSQPPNIWLTVVSVPLLLIAAYIVLYKVLPKMKEDSTILT